MGHLSAVARCRSDGGFSRPHRAGSRTTGTRPDAEEPPDGTGPIDAAVSSVSRARRNNAASFPTGLPLFQRAHGPPGDACHGTVKPRFMQFQNYAGENSCNLHYSTPSPSPIRGTGSTPTEVFCRRKRGRKPPNRPHRLQAAGKPPVGFFWDHKLLAWMPWSPAV